MSRRLAIALFSLGLLGMKGEPFRYARELTASAPGWAVLELPGEVLAAARPGLADVRITGPKGELAYALEERLPDVARVLSLQNVERVPGATTALADRGPNPPLASALVLGIDGSEPFLKPVVVEASDDGRVFAELARTSLFRADARATVTEVRFSPNDRRYVRVRFDDTQSPPVVPRSIQFRQTVASEPALREVSLTPEPVPQTEARGSQSFTLQLPSANLPVVALEVAARDAAFSRGARVYERIVFRGELEKRLVGAGRLERSAAGTESTRLDLAETSAGALELELDGSRTPLDIAAVTALVRPRRLVFFAPDPPVARLLYGSAHADPPDYDLTQALSSGRPATLQTVTLGPVQDSGAVPALAPPARAPLAEAESWKQRQRILLPTRGTIAYLDVGGSAAARIHEVRILDARGQQVPFVVEAEERSVPRELTLTPRREGRLTRVSLGGFDPQELVSKLELHVSGPAYFERSLTLSAPIADRRGEIGRRELARANWQRKAGDAPAPLVLPVSVTGERELLLEIDDGDNPPLALTRAVAGALQRRIDFVFEPGETLALLSDNPAATTPRYDLALLRNRLLESSAERATLAEASSAPRTEPRAGTPRWFWWVAVAAGLLVVFVLVRVRTT